MTSPQGGSDPLFAASLPRHRSPAAIRRQYREPVYEYVHLLALPFVQACASVFKTFVMDHHMDGACIVSAPGRPAVWGSYMLQCAFSLCGATTATSK